MWSRCGRDAVQHVNEYSSKPGYAITSAASAAGNGDGNGNCDRALRAREITKTKRKMDSARAARDDHSLSRAGKELGMT
jgi:hypothetical protein